MLRSPLHLLISLHRYLLRSKARHRSSHLLFRPIMKTTSWSAGITSKLPYTSSTVLTKRILTHGQTNQVLRAIQQHSTLSTRRLFPQRRTHGTGSVCIQRRTMVSSGSSSNASSPITTVLNANHFFTPRPPILGVHGTPLLPPPPPTSFRSYSTKSPWGLRQQQHQYFISPSNKNENDEDSEYFDINTRLHRTNRQQQLANPSTVVGFTDDGDNQRLGQQSYRPPDIRGIADLMENNDDLVGGRSRHHTSISVVHSGGNGKKAYHPGLVLRAQTPRRTSSQQTHPSSSTTPKSMNTSPVDVLRYDDLSIQTTKKKISYDAAPDTTTTNDKWSQQQWYISIPMDLALPPYDISTSSSALKNLVFMENAVSILDPAWLASFDSWDKLVREHLTKVMALIQLVKTEAQRYATKSLFNVDDLATTTMDFKMMMTKSDTFTELHIYLPHQLLAPMPTNWSSIQHWIHQLMKDPPRFEIKCLTPTNNNSNMDVLTGMTMRDDDTTTSLETTRHTLEVDRANTVQVDDEDLVMVPSTMMETDQLRVNIDNQDDDSWHIGPHYFQGIHTFLNHVDSMIDSSPAFAASSSQRRLT